MKIFQRSLYRSDPRNIQVYNFLKDPDKDLSKILIKILNLSLQ